MPNSITTPYRAVGLVAVLLIAAACSSTGGASAPASVAASAPPPASTEASVAPPSEDASSAPSEAAGGSVTLTVVKNATLGDFLAGADGMTLYAFTPDATPGKSTCNGDCATNWPPLVEAVAGTGVSGTIATFARDDGSNQVSYNGKPLYYFAGDKAAGDTNGQGVGGKWFVAKP